MVRVVGLEPTLLSEADFESAASTISPHPHVNAPISAPWPGVNRTGERPRTFMLGPWRACAALQRSCRKRIALGQIAGLKTAHEPALPLF
jgi:hypothetical protein